MKIYENVVIGNFLYSLGFAIRARQSTHSMPSVVNLLQQTPSDTLLGDLLLQFPGVVRLLEFKVEENRANKERARHTALTSAVAANPTLAPVSRRVHLYVEASTSNHQGFAVRAVPYLDAYPRSKPRGRLEPFIESFADEVVRGRSKPGESDEEMEYIRWVRRLQGEGEVGTGGLLVVANADGSLHYAQLLDLLELRIEHRLWVELHAQRVERELAYQRQLEQGRKLALERTLEQDMGMGF